MWESICDLAKVGGYDAPPVGELGAACTRAKQVVYCLSRFALRMRAQ